MASLTRNQPSSRLHEDRREVIKEKRQRLAELRKRCANEERKKKHRTSRSRETPGERRGSSNDEPFQDDLDHFISALLGESGSCDINMFIDSLEKEGVGAENDPPNVGAGLERLSRGKKGAAVKHSDAPPSERHEETEGKNDRISRGTDGRTNVTHDAAAVTSNPAPEYYSKQCQTEMSSLSKPFVAFRAEEVCGSEVRLGEEGCTKQGRKERRVRACVFSVRDKEGEGRERERGVRGRKGRELRRKMRETEVGNTPLIPNLNPKRQMSGNHLLHY